MAKKRHWAKKLQKQRSNLRSVWVPYFHFHAWNFRIELSKVKAHQNQFGRMETGVNEAKILPLFEFAWEVSYLFNACKWIAACWAEKSWFSHKSGWLRFWDFLCTEKYFSYTGRLRVFTIFDVEPKIPCARIFMLIRLIFISISFCFGTFRESLFEPLIFPLFTLSIVSSAHINPFATKSVH